MSNSLSPIIVIGMHRSGTSLLARVLQDLGVFMGRRRDEHDEAILFRELNDWLLWQCGARWDTPGPIDFIWTNHELMSLSERYLRTMLRGPRSVQFLGWQRYLRGQRILEMNCDWGWKDPRNTYTLPLWCQIFPDARVINITRHGVDVAQSLVTRSKKGLLATSRRFDKHRRVVAFLAKGGGFVESPRCATLDGALSLWSDYVARASQAGEQVAPDRYLEVSYETLLSGDKSLLAALASFCGVEISDVAADKVIRSLDPKRAFSFRANESLVKFARDNAQELAQHGYATIPESP